MTKVLIQSNEERRDFSINWARQVDIHRGKKIKLDLFLKPYPKITLHEI